MNKALHHRGPDDEGQLLQPDFSLAMRRLAIIDLQSGQQPIFNESGSIGVFFNGELYNYPELRAQLLAKGHVFRTHSDTEVLVHLYEDMGAEMLPHLKGMFAFCLFDLKHETFLLARDRFGEKPLYYHWKEQTLSFSSEIASLLENKHIARRLNLSALPYYFRTSLVPEPLTLLEGVQSLPPGHYLQLQNGTIKLQSYFQIDYRDRTDIVTEQDAMDYIGPLLESAVRRQTISDVPIGAFLSGGIDSSTVVALLQSQSARPVKTFHVRFEQQEYDESSLARRIAEHCGTDHHEVVVPNYDFSEDIFWEIIEHVGLPFRDSSAIPTYLISRAISKEVKVALSGDGGDELFGGYDLFRWHQKIIDLKRVPEGFRKAGHGLLTLAQRIPGLQKMSALRQVDRAIRTTFQPEDVIPISLNEMFTGGQVAALLPQLNGATNGYPLLRHYPEAATEWSPLRRIMHYRSFHTLPSNMLIKVDRMSMAHSLEVRAPFLDPDLFAAAAGLPDRFLIRGGQGKYLLRKLMADRLPAAVFEAPKQGFSIPLHKYQNEVFQKLAHRLVYTENPFPDLLPTALVDEIYREGLGLQKSDARRSVFKSMHRLWMLMQLFGWAQRFDVRFS